MEIHGLKPIVIRWTAGLALGLLSCPAIHAATADGYVVRVDSATVYLDWGTSSGVKRGDSFTVYRKGAALKHPVTGEVLGNASQTVGEGAIESVEEKFSTGRLMNHASEVKPGDRTRYDESAAPAAAPVSAPTAVPSSSGTATPTSSGLRERWRSEPIGYEAAGVTLGDLDGDGKKDVIVAYRDRIEAYRWSGQKLEPMGTFKSRGYQKWVAVEAGDLEKAGRDKVFATAFLDGMHRGRVVVLAFQDGAFKEQTHFEGFVRGIPHGDGRSDLIWMGMSMASELRVLGPSLLTYDGKNYKPGAAVPLPRQLRDDQLFGFAMADFDGDKKEDFAELEGGERLRLFLADAKWSSSEVWGGTKNDIGLENDRVASLHPRLGVRGGEKPQLLVPHNLPELGVRMTYLKLYRKSELAGLSWNGLEMATVWKQPLPGYLADFMVGDAMAAGTPQVWTAVVGPGGKTVLTAYDLP